MAPNQADAGAASRPPREFVIAGLAVALLLAMADMAVETFWSASPVRWWLVGAFVLHAAVTALTWRRVGWRTKATASAMVFGAVVGGTAWLPGGLIQGVRLAGQPTATLLSVLAAAGVMLAAIVLLRMPALPRALRWGMAALAVYGVAAFAYGLATRMPFPALLAGSSPWQRLPYMLQGAVIGGLVIVPLALVASVVSAGVPRFGVGSPRRSLYQAVALATSFSVILAAVPFPGSPGARASGGDGSAVGAPAGLPPISPLVPSPGLSASLESSLQMIDEGDRLAPRDRWDPTFVVQQLGRDPAALFAWVQRSTYWIPYLGMLRGPVGVLMDRQGNSADRALLLARLLQDAGHTVRLARGELPREQAARLMPGLIGARPAGMTSAPPAQPSVGDGFVRTIAVESRVEPTRIAAAYHATRDANAGIVRELAARVPNQVARLAEALPVRASTRDAWGSRLDAAIQALRDHWWVQRQDGEAWIDMDLLGAAASTGSSGITARETIALTDIAAAPRHEVAVSVIAEQWTAGAVRTRSAFRHVLAPADLIGKPIVLRFWPLHWPSTFPPEGMSPASAIQAVSLQQRQWLVTLLVGRTQAAQISLRDTGDVNEKPAVDPMAKAGDSSSVGAEDAADVLTSIGRPAGAPLTDPKSVLTAAWFEFEIRVPGERPRVVRHTIFDLLGPTARAARPVPAVALDDARTIARSLSLTMETEILPIACRLAPEYVAHLLARSMVDNRKVLESLAKGEISDATMKPEDLGKVMAPIPTPLYGLALARFEWARLGDVAYIDRPNVLTRHIYLSAADGRLSLRDATDIVANEVGVDLRVEDAVAVRLEQGVVDTNAEALIRVDSGRIIGNSGSAFAAPGEWVALTSANDARISMLAYSEDDRRRVAEELAAGYQVVAPKSPVSLGAEPYVGWWRIDPATGTTLGVDTNGWGATLVEYAFLLSEAFALGFLFAYLYCTSGPRSSPGSTTASRCLPGEDGWRVPGLDYLVAPVAARGGSGCLADAVQSGIFGALFGLGLTLLPAGWGGGGWASGGGGGGGRGGGGGAGAGSGGGRGGTGGGSGGGSGGGTGGNTGTGTPGGTPAGSPAGSGGGATGSGGGVGQSGPYRGDPAGRALIEGNPNSDATQFMGGKQYLNNLFKGADAAAEQAYTAAKVQGFDDQAAHNFSAQVWSKYVSEWKAPVGGPGFPIPGNMEGANPYGVTQPGVGSGGAPVVVQPGANPLGATQPGANPYGATQPGTSPFATTQPGSPLATTVNPGANPYGATQPGANPYGATQPGGTALGTTQPGANPYGATQPGGTALGTTQPGANPYGATQPGGTALGTTQPGANPYGATLPGGSPYGAPQPGTTPGGSTPLVPKPSGSTPIGVNPCGDARSGPCAGQTGSGTGLTPSAKLFGGMTGLQTILSGGK